MKDRYNLDSHKFYYHTDAINDFVLGNDAKPIYVEISPTAFCNHKCLFCHYNYLGHKGKFEDSNRLMSLMDEIKELGAKSLVFAGIGEPLLNKDTVPSIRYAKSLGLDIGMSTNGALLKKEDFETLANSLTWIRFSVNATTQEAYANIHQTKQSDFELVLSNIKKLVEMKQKIESQITVGVQFILLPQNYDSLEPFIKRIKQIGVDYFVIKQFYKHEKNEFKIEENFPNHQVMNELLKLSIKYNDDSFNLIVRSPQVLEEDRRYSVCYGLPYVLYIREDGNLFSCFSYQHNQNTVLGNIFEHSLTHIWKSPRKKKAIDYINTCIDKRLCQPSCRHHHINNYLWDLKHPSGHINFI